MAKTVVPVVGYSELKAEGYPTAIRVGSPAWFEWLVNHRSFRYECSRGHFTACKESRKGGNFWYANRRVDGKLRRSYLGASNDLTLEKLEEVAIKLSGSERTYEQRKSYTTANQSDSCVTAGNQELLKQLSKLQAQLEQQEEEVLRLEDVNTLLQEENKKLKQKFDGLPDLEREMREEINRLHHFQLENDLLKTWNQELRSQLEVGSSEVEIDLTTTKIYQLHKRPVVRLEDLDKLGCKVIHPDWLSSSHQVGSESVPVRHQSYS